LEPQSHKNAIIIFLALLLIVGGWFSIFELKNTQEKVAYSSPKEKTAENDSYIGQDKDGDGLLDWAEELLGTDPANPDTDNDGTPDGEEITLKRNPLKADNDALSLPENDGKSLSGLSAQIAGGIAGEYLLLKEKGGANQEEIINTLTAQIVSRINAAGAIADAYTVKDIRTIASSPAVTHAYINEVGSILNARFANINTGEIELLNAIIETQSFDRLQEFDTYVRAYENAMRDLLALSAPDSFSSMHIALINNFSNLSRINTSFVQFETDPASALVNLRYYQSETERFKIVIKNINVVLEQAGVFFADTENGSVVVEYYNELKNNGAI